MTTPATRDRADGLRMACAVPPLSARDDWAGRVVRRAVVDGLACEVR
jgi:hypothetical protein